MATVYSADIAITLDISSLGTSSTFLVGIESGQVDATAGTYNDYLVSVAPITGHASTAPTIGQYIGIWVWGSNVSLSTTAIDTLDGTSSAETLSHASILNSLKRVAAPDVTAATASLTYYAAPFTIARLFGGVVPRYWGLFVAHNHTGALAAAQSSLFTMRGITFT